jgi:hypothetical protein
MHVAVSSSIQEQLYRKWKASGLKLSHVIALGLNYEENVLGLKEKMNEQEVLLAKFREKVNTMGGRILELEMKQ